MNGSVLIPSDIRFPLERANGVQVVKTAAALAELGMPAHLVVRDSDPRPTPEILELFGIGQPPGLSVTRLDVGHGRGPRWMPRARFLGKALRRGLSHLRKGGCVYTRDLQLAQWLLRWRRGRQGTLVYEAHAVEAVMYQERAQLYGSRERAGSRKIARLAGRERAVWRAADGVITTTRGIAEAFAAAYGPRPHTAVIANGCDVSKEACPPPLPVDRPPRVLYAGQLYPWKGVDVLIEAMAWVPEARLVIVGGLEGEQDLARIRRLVDWFGLGERAEIRPTIPQSEVRNELSRAYLAVVPFRRTAMSERHTSPLKAFEAMAAGRPIVASDLPSTREILEDGRTALLVPPGDAEALGGAIRRLIEHPLLARSLARAAYDRAPEYAWPARARKIRALLEECRADSSTAAAARP